MKIFAVILSIFIFALSVDAFGEIGCLCDKHEITANMDVNSQSGDNDGCAAGCSPFHLCHTCSGFTISPAFHVTKPVSYNKPSTPIPHTQQFISAFYGNIWQPPKIG